MQDRNDILTLLRRFKELGIESQIDYDKFYLYSIITHSTAIEGSTVTEIENQLLFDEGIAPAGKTVIEQMMNLDLKAAYEQAMRIAKDSEAISVDMLCHLSSLVLKNTGAQYNTLQGSFDASKGELRLLNVSAGVGGRSYMNFLKVPARMKEFCALLNAEPLRIADDAVLEAYEMSFRAHFRLVTIHPWADGNGRMSRLVMNLLQWEKHLLPTIVYKEHKASYIQALIDSREQEDESIFCDFMFSELRHFLTLTIAEYEKSLQGDVPVNVPVNVPVKPSGRKAQIVEMMASDSGITIRELAARLGVTEKTIKRDIAALRGDGFVSREGSDKAGRWIVSK